MPEIAIPFGDQELSALWDEAPDARALAVITHGAGNDIRRPFFTRIAAALVDAGVSVLRFNFPYMSAGRRAPDRPAVLMAAWRAALDEAARRAGGAPVVAGGKSLGGRMASMVAAEDGDAFAADALVFFGYPLHAPGRTENLRDEHLFKVEVPMLFIEGTADALARFDLMEDLVERLGDRAQLHAIDGGDHSFRVRGVRRDDREIGEELGAIAAHFVREVVR
ncbi:MAG: alpha/beta family hydrolase [Actinomycetota bacterium]